MPRRLARYTNRKMKIQSGGIKVAAFAAIFIICVGIAYQILKPTDRLPVYQPADINPRLVDPSFQTVKSDHRISDFTLVNQDSVIKSKKDIGNRIVVASFIFTTCPSICPKMTANMATVADEYKGTDKILFISHSVTPDIDTPSVLKAYAQEHNAGNNWWFLTGDKAEIYRLARKSYFAALDEPSTEGADFVHTENFVLVDPDGRLRGFYDGTSKIDCERLADDLKTLLKEYE